jgi:hypothetical protein
VTIASGPFLYTDVGDPRVVAAVHPVRHKSRLYGRDKSLTVRRTDDTGIFTSRVGDATLPVASPLVYHHELTLLVCHAPISGEWELRMARDDTIGPKWCEVMMGRIYSNRLLQTFEKKKRKFIFPSFKFKMWRGKRGHVTRTLERRVAQILILKLKPERTRTTCYQSGLMRPRPSRFWGAVIFFY